MLYLSYTVNCMRRKSNVVVACGKRLAFSARLSNSGYQSIWSSEAFAISVSNCFGTYNAFCACALFRASKQRKVPSNCRRRVSDAAVVLNLSERRYMLPYKGTNGGGFTVQPQSIKSFANMNNNDNNNVAHNPGVNAGNSEIAALKAKIKFQKKPREIYRVSRDWGQLTGTNFTVKVTGTTNNKFSPRPNETVEPAATDVLDGWNPTTTSRLLDKESATGAAVQATWRHSGTLLMANPGLGWPLKASFIG